MKRGRGLSDIKAVNQTHTTLLPLPKRLRFQPCLFVCLLVGEQDNIKTTEQISVKLGGRMGLSPEWTPSTLSVDANGRLQECFQVAGILDPVSLNDTGLSSFILDWTNK